MWFEDLPHSGCAAMADSSLVAAGECGREAPAFEGEFGVADRVNTAMKAM